MKKLTVFYDGLCQLCSREINHYKTQAGADLIQFVDITSSTFDAAAEGIDPVKAHQVMHVKTTKGEILIAVDAFIEIWKVLPRYKWAARIAQIYLVKKILLIFYYIFAIGIRPYLPKRKNNDCSESPYCPIDKK